jgi:hypothetical protein
MHKLLWLVEASLAHDGSHVATITVCAVSAMSADGACAGQVMATWIGQAVSMAPENTVQLQSDTDTLVQDDGGNGNN